MYSMICRPDNLHMSRTDKSKLDNFSKFYFNNMCASRPIVWILIVAWDKTFISLKRMIYRFDKQKFLNKSYCLTVWTWGGQTILKMALKNSFTSISSD